jgi:TRAP-type C4-dicarboxylate transport system permease small subunit
VEKAYAIWCAFLDRFLARAAAILLLGSTLLALLEVVRRYVMGVSFDWQQDAVTYFILSSVFLYFCIAQRRNDHLSVEVLVTALQSLGPRAKRAAEIIQLVALVLSFFFMLAVVWWGVPEVRESIHYATRTESLAFPMAPFLVTLLVSFALMAVSMFFQVYRGWCRLLGRRVLEDPPDPDVPLH